MFIVENYLVAVLFCFITMLCWGSWANTQKMVSGKWRYELFYWDYVIGIFVFSLIAAFTLGSFGDSGRSFVQDLSQASFSNIRSAFIGGVIFNLANILLATAIAIAGMSVAFPIGIGIALILGVIVNYFLIEKGDPLYLFIGVALVAIAIVLNGIAFRLGESGMRKAGLKGILISVLAGILMSLFYRFVASSMDLNDFVSPASGKMTPYTACVVFATGILLSNILFNTIMMKRPIQGAKLSYREYFSGRKSLHLVGLLGGSIWALGNLFNLIAAGKAGPAVSYGLGQGATLIAVLWGVVVWREFKNASPKIVGFLTGMFIFFIAGLGLIIISGK
jgi:glucose uptake protein